MSEYKIFSTQCPESTQSNFHSPLVHPHTSGQAVGPSEPLEALELAFQQIQGLDLQPIFGPATGMASQSCNCSWH